ncbi:MAG: nitroreductase [Saprospiraceae bacterium]|jgi:nitroreductase
MMDLEKLNEIIRGRRAIFPPMYDGTPISREIIMAVLENANWAPTHKNTEPWRFKVMVGEALQRLSDFLGEFYKIHTPEDKFSKIKYEKTIKKPLQCACVVAVCMQRDPAESIPEWEEIASVSCAVQNMWLTATAHGVGAYWSSPNSIHAAEGLLNLKEGERCLGFFYMGNYKGEQLPGKRTPIASKVSWIE